MVFADATLSPFVENHSGKYPSATQASVTEGQILPLTDSSVLHTGRITQDSIPSAENTLQCLVGHFI